MTSCIYILSQLHEMKINVICLFFIESMDLAYETTPEMPDFVWISSSVVFALEFCIGGVTNLTIVFCYLKNISVRC